MSELRERLAGAFGAVLLVTAFGATGLFLSTPRPQLIDPHSP